MGIGALRDIVERAESATTAPPPKRGPGRPRKNPLPAAPPPPAMTDAEIRALSATAMRLPYQIGAAVSHFMARTDAERATAAELWKPDPEELELGGFALEKLARRYAPEIVEHLPAIILGAVLVAGIGGRAFVTRAEFARMRRAAEEASRAPRT